MGKVRNRLFQAWFRFRRPMTLGVRAAVEGEDGKVLMVRHTYTPGWHMPGGGVEKSETALAALTRELQEEGGVELTGSPLLFGVYSNHASFRNDHVLLYRVPLGFWKACQATSNGEIAEIAWIDPKNPPEGTTPGTRRRLKELYDGTTLTALW